MTPEPASGGGGQIADGTRGSVDGGPGASTRGVLVAVLGSFASPAVGFLTAPVLARALGVDGRGTVAAANAPLMLAVSAMTLGLPEAVTYYVARNRHRGRELARRGALWSLVIGAGASVVIAIAAEPLSGGNDQLARLTLFVGLCAGPLLALGIVRGAAAGLGRWRVVGAEGLLTSLARLLILIGLAVGGELTTTSAALTVAASGLLGFAVYARLFGGVPRHEPEVVSPRPSLFGFGLGMWLGAGSGVLLTYLDQALMTTLSSERQLGLYAVAVSVVQAITVVNDVIKKVTFSLEAGSPNEARLALAARMSTMATAVVCLAAAVTAPVMIPLIFGREYSPSVVLIEILLLSLLIFTPGSIAGAGLMARGRPILRSISFAVAAVLNLAFVLILVPPFGAVGAALAMLLSQPVAGFMAIGFLRFQFGVPLKGFVAFRRDDWAAIVRTVRGTRPGSA